MAKSTCLVEGCSTAARARGLCGAHWQRWSKHGHPLGPGHGEWTPPTAERTRATCTVADCGKAAKGRGLCQMHLSRLIRTGTTDPKPPRGCTVDGCDDEHEALGYCMKHVTRLRRYGDPLFVKRIVGDSPARFWDKVDKAGAVPAHLPESGPCWFWTGTRSDEGYGSVRWEGPMLKAHRVAYELLVGPIPEGLEIDHLCRVTSCVNPAHLEPVTPAVNVARRWEAERERNATA